MRDIIHPHRLLSRAKTCLRCIYAFLTDTIAVMVAGASAPATQIVRTASSSLGTGKTSAIGSPRRLPVPDAILINAVAAHSLDFDDTIQGFAANPSCHLVPALLGLSSRLNALDQSC